MNVTNKFVFKLIVLKNYCFNATDTSKDGGMVYPSMLTEDFGYSACGMRASIRDNNKATSIVLLRQQLHR